MAGDERVNDNIVLTAMHTLFMRRANRLVDSIAADHPDWSAEDLYQRARKIVGAQLQAITFNEFLPALLGPHAPASSGNYDPELNPTVLNEFPTVFLRIGHSMLTNDFKHVQNNSQARRAARCRWNWLFSILQSSPPRPSSICSSKG